MDVRHRFDLVPIGLDIMHVYLHLPLKILCALCLFCGPCGFLSPASAQAGRVIVVITTGFGEIEAALDSARVPVTTAHFLKYVDEGLYDGGEFYWTVTMQNQPDNEIRVEVVQAGINPAFADRKHLMIPLERTRDTGLKHTDGTMSIGRTGVDTATYRFFICIGDQPELDFGGKRNADGQGFAAFGQVTRGMDIIRKIQRSSHKGQTLTPTIKITRIVRQ